MEKESISVNSEGIQLIPITGHCKLDDFYNDYEEYNVFLKEEALKYQELNISKTHLLLNTTTGRILAYMSLVADSILLSQGEKEDAAIKSIPFATFPALKIGKLAVDKEAKKNYYGIGTFMIELARGFAFEMNEQGVACRFITIDADVENNPSVIEFYIKNGFKPNEKINKKARNSVSMRKDIFED